MNTNLEDYITGFYLRPNYENDKVNKRLKMLEVELLKDGDVIGIEDFEMTAEELIEKVQLRLLERVVANVRPSEWANSKKEAKREKVLGVVNMFKINVLRDNEDGSQNIQVVFIKSGYVLFESMVIENVTKEKLETIRSILIDNTCYNLKCDSQCKAVTAIDLMAIIDQEMQK